MYVDEVLDYIERGGDRGAQLAGTWIPLLLYADDIVLISDSLEGMQRHLDALHIFEHDSGLSVNLGKTKVMVFNTTAQWVRRSTPAFMYGQETVEYTDAYTYLGVVFSGPVFSLRRATQTSLTRAYAMLRGCVRRFSSRNLGQNSSYLTLW